MPYPIALTKENDERYMKYFYDVASVVTLPEVCRCWDKNRKTVEMALARNRIYGVRMGGTWIISGQSVVDCWGQPSSEPEYK